LLRLAKILWIALRFGLDSSRSLRGSRLARALMRSYSFARSPSRAAVRCAWRSKRSAPFSSSSARCFRRAATSCPPTSPTSWRKLQDRVPPFPVELAVAEIERAFGRPIAKVFEKFELQPRRERVRFSAQVHLAVLPGGTEAAVKILAAGMMPVDREDLA